MGEGVVTAMPAVIAAAVVVNDPDVRYNLHQLTLGVTLGLTHGAQGRLSRVWSRGR